MRGSVREQGRKCRVGEGVATNGWRVRGARLALHARLCRPGTYHAPRITKPRAARQVALYIIELVLAEVCKTEATPMGALASDSELEAGEGGGGGRSRGATCSRLISIARIVASHDSNVVGINHVVVSS